MLTRLIVQAFSWIIEFSLWLMLFGSGVFGYNVTISELRDFGLTPENEMVWQFFGALFFVAATFVVLALITGPFLILLDIRNSLRSLETKDSDESGKIRPSERREPRL